MFFSVSAPAVNDAVVLITSAAPDMNDNNLDSFFIVMPPLGM